jgi:hypothetical protein
VYVADTLNHRIQKFSPALHHRKVTLTELGIITLIVFGGSGFIFFLKAWRII